MCLRLVGTSKDATCVMVEGSLGKWEDIGGVSRVSVAAVGPERRSDGAWVLVWVNEGRDLSLAWSSGICFACGNTSESLAFFESVVPLAGT